MLIDSHSHWLPEEIVENARFFSGAWNDIESHLLFMDAAKIGKAVLSYPTSDAHLKLGGRKEVSRIYNDAVAGILRRFPGRFIGAAVLPVGDPREMVEEMNRVVDELGFRAVSLSSSYDGMYLDDTMFAPVYQNARRFQVPVFVHSQIVNPIGFGRVADPLLTPVIEYIFDTTICIGKLLMSDILREYADVKFIFGYFGGMICNLRHRFDATYQMLRAMNYVKDLRGNPTDFLKNIYVDTSGDTNRANFLAALELLGPGRILWGSDWPAKKDPGEGIEAVKSLPISVEEQEDILGGNLARILK
ncbi:MAG: amidohydrolase family protein [Candidatus Omnitrophica bacterium]|nr:amidohydrolase family protein [Candidatus Omnitrophota bacterium]